MIRSVRSAKRSKWRLLAPRVLVGSLTASIALSATVADASAGLPQPGTPAQVARLVTASVAIAALPKDLNPVLANVADNTPTRYYPVTKNGCSGVLRCVFGKTDSTVTVVLFGDSHAWMWLPPLANVATALGWRLVLMWKPGCPAASLSVWNPSSHSILSSCDTYRATSLAQISRLNPALVLLSNRTTNMYGAHRKRFTSAQWQSGLEHTIAALKTKSTAVAVIGDITAFTVELPNCLAAYPTHVQHCSAPNPNVLSVPRVVAERAAAAAQSVHYIDPRPWLCKKRCSPVIGSMAAYFDSLHVSAVYAEYLTLEFEGALKGIL